MVIIAYRLFLSVILVNCYVKCMYFDLLLIGCCNEYRFCLFQSCQPPISKCNFEVKNFAAVICMLEWQYKEGKLELSMGALIYGPTKDKVGNETILSCLFMQAAVFEMFSKRPGM